MKRIFSVAVFVTMVIFSGNIFAQKVTQAWVRQYAEPDSADAALAIDVDQFGNVYVSGFRGIIKYNPEGNREWFVNINFGARFMKVDGENIYLFGIGADYNYAIAKYVDGNRRWLSQYGQDGWNEPKALAIDGEGNVYVAGMSGERPDFNYLVMKIDPDDGNVNWITPYDGPIGRWDEPSDIAIDNLGNVYITGRSQQDSSSDYATVKYNFNGVQQWVVRYGQINSGKNWNAATAIAIDNSGGVYVTGYSGQFNGHLKCDYTTIKYDSNGEQQWVVTYDDPSDGGDWDIDIPIDLVVDSAGDIYVTGYSWSPQRRFDFTTIKYNTEGNQQWLARYNGPLDDNPTDMTIDNWGSIYVTGWSYNYDDDYDFITIKYTPAGLREWVIYYLGSAKSKDRAEAIAVDGENVYVTGWSVIDKRVFYTTVKYTQPYLSYLSSSVITEAGNLPLSYALYQNYPNPFNPVTTINYQLPEAADVTLKVYNIFGQEIATLVETYKEAGYYQVTWDAKEVASGVYFYTIKAGTFEETKKMVLIK